MSYQSFLDAKAKRVAPVGIEVDPSDIHPSLFEWQRNGVMWALRTGRCALFWDTGLGKTRAQVEWARLSADTSLILAPLSVARQTARESRKIDVDVRYARSQSEVDGPGVWITNYEMADRFDAGVFGAVVLDECFPAGTLVDTPSGARPIESIRRGDLVLSAKGSCRVRDTATRRKRSLVRVYAQDREYTCSEHHPWLTPRGWIAAKDLRHGDQLISQDEAMRLLRGELQCSSPKPEDSLLRTVLLGEVENASTGDLGASSCAGGSGEARSQEGGMAGVWQPRRPSRDGAYPCAEPFGGSAKRDARRGVRRVLARVASASRSEEGCEAGRARVDRAEVLQPGDPRFDRLSGGADSVALYDLDVEGHPSFSVGGLLVHNSSILKNVDGKTRAALTLQFAGVPRRLACTATPAPNDVAELTNHAAFLGVMSRAEMLAAYFVNDEREWRLKGHAAEPMFRWMASWAQAVRRPSDLGYSDDGFALPPLHIVPEVVMSELESEGQLFATDLGGVGGRAAVRRRTLEDRVARAAQLAAGEHQWIVWCGLNDEAKLSARLIDGAVNVEGSWTPDAKAQALEAFQDGEIRVLVTKPSLAGLGMNFQNASRMAFVGLNDSFESYYQAIRRCWRFGQSEPVYAHVVVSGLEAQIVQNVQRKERDAARAMDRLIQYMRPEMETV